MGRAVGIRRAGTPDPLSEQGSSKEWGGHPCPTAGGVARGRSQIDPQPGRWAMGADQMPRAKVFTNPLPDVVLGDPFVLRHRGRFYLYGTNDGPPLPDGRMIPVFRSDDLLHWEHLGGALEPSEPEADHWAPEVMYWNGRFFMVVSFGDVD